MADDQFEFDPWEFSSGLPDNLTVRVDNPHFGYDAQRNDGEACLFILEGTILGGDDVDSTELNQWYTCGKDWEPADKGTRLVRTDGDRRKSLNKQSNYARLSRSLMATAADQGLSDIMRKRGNPYEASLWQDLEIVLTRTQDSFKNQQGEKIEYTRLEVSHINNVAGVPVTAGRPAASPSASSGGLSPKLKVSLSKLAKAVKAAGGDHSAFAEQAFSDIDGVLDNPVAEDAVMATDAGSVWADA